MSLPDDRGDARFWELEQDRLFRNGVEILRGNLASGKVSRALLEELREAGLDWSELSPRTRSVLEASANSCLDSERD